MKMFSNLIYSKSERNFVNVKTYQLKKPLAFFDKDNMIKIMSVGGEYCMYELDSVKCKINLVEERSNILQ